MARVVLQWMFSLYVCTTNENHLFRKVQDITINLLLRYLFFFFHVYFLHLDLFVRVLGASLLFSTSKLKALFIQYIPLLQHYFLQRTFHVKVLTKDHTFYQRWHFRPSYYKLYLTTKQWGPREYLVSCWACIIYVRISWLYLPQSK